MSKKLNKQATKAAIIEAAKSNTSMSIDVTAFNMKINSEKDILNACTFAKVEPIYTESEIGTRKIVLDEKQKQSIVDQCIERIKEDLKYHDETAIDELLKFVPDEYLIGFLPDDDQPRYY